MELVTLLSVLVAPSLTTCPTTGNEARRKLKSANSAQGRARSASALVFIVCLAVGHRVENRCRQDWRFTANEPEMVETRNNYQITKQTTSKMCVPVSGCT